MVGDDPPKRHISNDSVPATSRAMCRGDRRTMPSRVPTAVGRSTNTLEAGGAFHHLLRCQGHRGAHDTEDERDGEDGRHRLCVRVNHLLDVQIEDFDVQKREWSRHER
jgi:hypothetical protein